MATRKDSFHALCNWLSYNRFLVAGALISLVIAVCFAACAPTTQSIVNPDREVTAAELQREIVAVQADYDAKVKAAEAANADLSAQYESRARIVEAVGAAVNLAASGGLNPVSGAAAGVQLLTLLAGIGLVLDNRRKDKKIEELGSK